MRAGLNLKDSPHLIKRCNKCGAEIVWLSSRKTGRAYPVAFRGLIDVFTNDLHKCDPDANLQMHEQPKLAQYKPWNSDSWQPVWWLGTYQVRKVNTDGTPSTEMYTAYIVRRVGKSGRPVGQPFDACTVRDVEAAQTLNNQEKG